MVNGRAVKKTVARDLAIRTVFAQAEAIFHDARYVRRARLQATDAGYPRHALAEVGPVKWGKSIDKRWDASSASALPHFGPGDELVESLSAGAAASTPSAEARAVAAAAAAEKRRKLIQQFALGLPGGKYGLVAMHSALFSEYSKR